MIKVFLILVLVYLILSSIFKSVGVCIIQNFDAIIFTFTTNEYWLQLQVIGLLDC